MSIAILVVLNGNRYSMTTADPTRPHLVDKLPQSRLRDSIGYGIRSISGTGKPDMGTYQANLPPAPTQVFSLGAGRKSSRP